MGAEIEGIKKYKPIFIYQKMKKLIIIFLLFGFFGSTAQDLYLHCGKLIDTKNGKVLTNKTIVVSGKKIIGIENGFIDPTNSEAIIIDLRQKTVMPGLIDMHVHLEGETNPNRYLEAFTLNDADVATMLGSIDHVHIAAIIDALCIGDANALMEIVNELSMQSRSFGLVLDGRGKSSGYRRRGSG